MSESHRDTPEYPYGGDSGSSERQSSEEQSSGGESSEEQSSESKTREQSREVAKQGQQKASEYAGEGKERAKSQIATQKERASGELDGISRALRKTGSQLREQDQGSIGNYAEQAAGQTDRLSSYLHQSEPDHLIADTEDFARKRPAVFLGSAFAAGMLAARFLKSSSGERQDIRESPPAGSGS